MLCFVTWPVTRDPSLLLHGPEPPVPAACNALYQQSSLMNTLSSFCFVDLVDFGTDSPA